MNLGLGQKQSIRLTDVLWQAMADLCKWKPMCCEILTRLLCSWNQCRCHPGFQLKRDGKTCVDIDECTTTYPCSQRCINTHGSFHCLCVDGFELSPNDPTICKSTSGKARMCTFWMSLMARSFSVLSICFLSGTSIQKRSPTWSLPTGTTWENSIWMVLTTLS